MIKRVVENKEISDRRLLTVLFVLVYSAIVAAPLVGYLRS
jgi:hypothetical protein